MKPPPSLAEYAGLGTALLGAFLLPLLGGVGLDALTHKSPLFLLVGLVVGLLATAATAFVRFRRFL